MNVKRIEKYDMESLWFTDFAGEPERCWFAAGNFNSFFEANLTTGEAIFLGRFSREKLWKKMLYQCCTKYGNKILFAPALASSIAIYDIEKKILDEFTLPDNLSVQDTKFLFIVSYDNICFLIGSVKPVIVCVDLLNNHISYDYDFLDRDALSDVKGIVDQGHFWERDYIKKEDYFILISYRLGIYLKYYIKEKRAEQFAFSSGFCNTIGGVMSEGENTYAYLSSRNTITCIRDQVRQDFCIQEEIYRNLKRFIKSYFIGDNYYVFTDSSIIIKINFFDKQIEYVNVSENNLQFVNEEKKGEFFRCVKLYNGEFFLLHLNGNLLVKYNNEIEELAKQRVIPVNVSMVELDYNGRYKGITIQEDSLRAFVNVEYLVQLIERMNMDDKEKREGICIGRDIFQAI